MSMLSACFVTSILPEPKKKKSSAPTPAEKKPPPPAAATPGSLPPSRILRRLALDLLGSLPPPSDIAAVSEEPEDYFDQLLDHYLATAEARSSIAQLHRRVWQVRTDQLPDLMRLAEAGDSKAAALANNLAMRFKLTEEPLLRLRYILDSNRPFPDLFRGSWTIIHPDLADYYDLTDTGQAWIGENYEYGQYNDGRPEIGIITSTGMLATEDGRGYGDATHRTNQLLGRVTCAEFSQVDAHLFQDLSEADLATDLSQLAAKKSPCRSCHAVWSDATSAVAGLGVGTSFDTWHRYQPEQNVSGSWSGLAFTDGASLGELVGSDPRTHRCAIERLIMALWQRPLTSGDKNLTTQTLDTFYANSQRLMSVLPTILRSEHYRYAAVSPSVPNTYHRNASGVRFLRRDQWQGIIRQLTYSGDSINLPELLDVGFDETLSSDDQIPSGGYWYAVDRVARQLASLIVSEELQAGRTAASRRVLNKLPDGVGTTANTAIIAEQILVTWQLLVADPKVDTSSSPVNQLISMWQELNPDDSEEEFHNAWRTVLTAMLSHPNFLIY